MGQRLSPTSADRLVVDRGQAAGQTPVLVRASAVELALGASADMRRGVLPTAFCADVGRSLLLAELDFSSWVLRRVERIRFEDDRNVHREMSVELRVRQDTPVFVDDTGNAFWVVPLMMMRRRTLVDFHMHDEEHRPVTMPGLRLVQQLDQSLLLAAAASVPADSGRSLADDADVRTFVQQLVAGTESEVDAVWIPYAQHSKSLSRPRLALRESPLFHSVARMLRRSFSLYVLLPVGASRDRLLHLSFVEPVRWAYQLPALAEVAGAPGTWLYGASQGGSSLRLKSSHLGAALGLRPTRIRFQVPSAERAASYHVELVAPPGVRIGRATLIAGRPNDPVEPSRKTRAPLSRPTADHEERATRPSRPTFDHEESATLTVGLHGVEVPPGSLCRAQVDLRVQSAGWLAVIVWTAWAITAVLIAVALHAADAADSTSEQDNVVVLLLSTAAAAAAVVAHREFGGVAARMLGGVRVLAAACMGLPVVAAGFVLFQNTDSRVGPDVSTELALWVLTGLALLLAAFLTTVYALSWLVERAGRPRSPWNMTPETRRAPFRRPTIVDEERPPPDGRKVRRKQPVKMHVHKLRRRQPPKTPFHEELARHGFDRPAVGIPSSDAWHERYDVTDASHADALKLLTDTGMAAGSAGSPCCRRTDSGSCCRQAGAKVAEEYERALKNGHPTPVDAEQSTRPADAPGRPSVAVTPARVRPR